MSATVMGAFGVLLRWLQCEAIFPDDSGLPVEGAPISGLVILALAGFTLVLWWLSGRLPVACAPKEPEDALAASGREIRGLLLAASVVTGVGGLLLFFRGEDTLVRLAGLAGFLAAPMLAMYPYLPRWGGMGAFLSIVPVAFFALWLVGFYKENAVNPVVWEYGVQVLAIAACLYAAFQLCGYLFYRANPRRAAFGCALAMVFCLTVLTEESRASSRTLFAGWGLGFGAMCWLVVRNFVPAQKNYEEY